MVDQGFAGSLELFDVAFIGLHPLIGRFHLLKENSSIITTCCNLSIALGGTFNVELGITCMHDREIYYPWYTKIFPSQKWYSYN